MLRNLSKTSNVGLDRGKLEIGRKVFQVFEKTPKIPFSGFAVNPESINITQVCRNSNFSH